MKHITELAEACAKLQADIRKEVLRHKDNSFNHDIPFVSPQHNNAYLKCIAEEMSNQMGWAKHYAYQYVVSKDPSELEKSNHYQSGYTVLLSLYKDLINLDASDN